MAGCRTTLQVVIRLRQGSDCPDTVSSWDTMVPLGVLTAIYLVGILPLLGIQLPFAKALIAVTFLTGLLPVIGNLISNTVIVVVSLSVSFGVALGSLAFLIVIHKLEYFLNARIVGGEIKASAWELLCAMLAFEAAFGLPGLVAAPIFYAYGKAELRQLGLI